MSLDLDYFGKPGKYLASRGWTIVPFDGLRGTAACSAYNKQILVKPSVFAKPNLRVRKYVLPHEIWHGIHYEVNKYAVTEIVLERGIDRRSAIEVVADGACLRSDRSRSMRLWVSASVVWHGKVGYRYTISDIKSPSAITAIDILNNAVEADSV